MDQKEKGYTLIEVLAVLVILSILLGIAIPAVAGYLKRGTRAYYNGIETDVLAAGRDYLLDYKSLYPREIGNATVVTLDELTENKYIDVPKDEDGNPCDGTVTVVKKGTNNYEYHVCLKCGDHFTSDDKECSYVGNNNELRDYEITLNADIPATVKQGESLTIPEATVTEKTGGESNIISTTVKGNPSSIDTTVLSTNTITWSYRTKKITRTVQVVDTVAPVIESIQLSKASGSSYDGEITNKDSMLKITAKDYACESGSTCRTKYPKLDGSGIKAVYYKEKSATNWKVYTTNKNNITIPLNESFWGTLQVKVVDNVGKESVVKELQIQMDKEKPSKTIVDYLSGSSSTKWQNNIKIKLSATDNQEIKHYEIYKDGTYYGTTGENWTPPNNFSSNNVTFRAVDTAGNKGDFSDSQKIHMDTENPSKTEVDLHGYVSGSWTNQNVKQSFTATDNVGVTFYEYAYDRETTGIKTDNPWTISDDGEWTIWVRASDEAGNKGEWSNTYIVRKETEMPTVTYSVRSGTVMTGTTQKSTVTVQENISGIASLKYLWSKEKPTKESDFPTSFTNPQEISSPTTLTGDNYLWIYVRDHAGNENISQSDIFHYHYGDSTEGTGCYTVPVQHFHTGDSSQQGGCYTVEVNHKHNDSCYNHSTCSVTPSWPNFDGGKPCSLCGRPSSYGTASGTWVHSSCGASGTYSFGACAHTDCPNDWRKHAYTHVYKTTLSCTKKEGNYWDLGCGYTDGQIIGYTLGCGR